MNILYTIGPSSEHIGDELVAAGATGVRLTFSYGTPELQSARARAFRKSAKRNGSTVTIIADLEGSKPRLGEIHAQNGKQAITLTARSQVLIKNTSSSEVTGKGPPVLPLPDSYVFRQIKVGNKIVVGDGNASLKILAVKKGYIRALVEYDCEIEGRRGIYLQGSTRTAQALTEKDITALKYIATREEFDAVAISFVGTKKDVLQARKIMRDAGGTKPIIAKIETAEGVKNINEICRAADSIMVARGDLALTSPWEKMPGFVDTIVEACIRAGKPWIMATQIADGLNQSRLMTRAEMCDLWHWSNTGASGVLLSRETAWGPRPVEAIKAVALLASEAGR